MVLAILLAFSATALAGVAMLYPEKAALNAGETVQVGNVSRGETFDLAFSDNSGGGFAWDSISIAPNYLPPGWEVVSTSVNDASLTAKVRVPNYANPGNYPLQVSLSNAANSKKEAVTVAITLKENTLDVSFARGTGNVANAGEKVLYKAIATNNSIAPETVKLSANLPSTWFSEKTLELKPNTTQEIELAVTPFASGKHDFAFTAYSIQKASVVKSFSSELVVRPTLKGKLSSMFSGFPFFTFTLLPFQLLDSYLSLLFY